MARTSRVVALGLEQEVYDLWDQYKDYSRVAFLLNQQGHEVTALQIKGFLETYDVREERREGEEFPDTPQETVKPFVGQASIFEPLKALDEHYRYATHLMNAAPRLDTKYKFQRTHLDILRVAVAIQDRLASYETVFAFQQAVLEVLGRADPALVEQVFAELESRRSLRTILTERSVPEFNP